MRRGVLGWASHSHPSPALWTWKCTSRQRHQFSCTAIQHPRAPPDARPPCAGLRLNAGQTTKATAMQTVADCELRPPPCNGLRLDGGARNDDSQVGPPPLHLLQQAQKHVCGQGALVRFINHHHAVPAGRPRAAKGSLLAHTCSRALQLSAPAAVPTLCSIPEPSSIKCSPATHAGELCRRAMQVT